MQIDAAVTTEYLTIFLCGLPFILLVGKLFFGSWAGFVECLRFLLMPDLISLLRGQWGEDQWATMKFFVFLALCAGAVFSAHRYFYA